MILAVGAAMAANTTMTNNQGTATVNGTIIANTCQIYSDDINKQVFLEDVESNALKDPNSIADTKAFSIRLVNCSNAESGAFLSPNSNSQVKLFFDNNAPHVTPGGNLKDPSNNAVNIAKNVEIQLLNTYNEKIDLSKDIDEQNIPYQLLSEAGADFTFPLTACYVSKGKAVAGVFQAQLPLSIHYN